MFKSYHPMLEIDYPVEALAEKLELGLMNGSPNGEWKDDKFSRDIWETQTKTPYRLATGRDARQTHDSLYAKTPLNDHASVRAIFAKAASKKVDWTGDHRTVNQFSRYGRAQLSAPSAP